MNKAVFLDRDGVINRKAPAGEYVTSLEQVEFLPGVEEAIALLNESGFQVMVVTNQRCIAKGLISAEEMALIHNHMCTDLAIAGATIHAVYCCPHELAEQCDCRKPAPGMLLSAARQHNIHLADSWMIGDSAIDVAAGKNAGCKTARIAGRNEQVTDDADLRAETLFDAVLEILQAEAMAA